MDTGNLIGYIKNGSVDYKVGDKVICFRRNSRGHPRSIKDDVELIKFLLNEDKFGFEKVEVEYALYDTNVNHDSKWILGT